MRNKRGQFFLLAAVILSVILVTLSSTVNYANTNKEPDKFYDTSYEIKQEGGEVINYGIYKNEQVSLALANFTEKIGAYLSDADPDTEILFIYGNSSGVIVENFAKDDAQSGGTNTPGCAGSSPGKITITSAGTQINLGVKTNYGSYYKSCAQSIPLSSSNTVQVTLSNLSYDFAVTQNQEFLVIARKQAGNETYIQIK